MLYSFSSANISKCHFSFKHAPGDGGAIYVIMKSELKVFDSEFVENRATNGGSLGAHVSDCLIESSNFTSNYASHYGGCVSLVAANVTIKRSKLSGCEGKVGGSVSIRQHSTLQLEGVTISNSYSTGGDYYRLNFNIVGIYSGALFVGDISDLFIKDSIMTGCRSDFFGGIHCEGSRMYLESLLISSCFSSGPYDCMLSNGCTYTMDNVTFVDVHRAIHSRQSTINIYNSFVQNDVYAFFGAFFITYYILELEDQWYKHSTLPFCC